MNKNRRKEIAELSAKVSALSDTLTELVEEAERIRDEEQEYLDCMPENLRYSDRGYAAEEAVSNIDQAASSLDDMESSVSDIISSLEMAAE